MNHRRFPTICALLLLAAPGQAALIVVTNSADTGNGTLRQAILFANTNPGPDNITFNIPGASTHILRPRSILPPLLAPVTIDATTQPGYASNPLVELNGSDAGPNPGLRLLAGHCAIRGLAIGHFGGDGLRIEAQGTNVIQANFIGTDAAGLLARPNGQDGIFLTGSRGNLIGGPNPGDGNVISGNAAAGIYILNGGNNVIQGNFIGTTANGLGPLGNGNGTPHYGIAIYDSTANQLGGSTPSARNVISGNGGGGIYLYGAASTGNRIHGNWIGTDATGSGIVSNQLDGITVAMARGNLLGGGNPGEGNMIAGNGQAGINIVAASAGNLLQGNLIGTSGLTPSGNALAGIVFSDAGSNLVGGLTAYTRNVISGNGQDGVLLTNTVGVLVQGNFIGTDSTGTRSVPNTFNGISLHNANCNSIGGSAPGARNIISGNAYYGAHLASGSKSNSILGNYIGLRVSGDAALGNATGGLRLESAGNTVGGPGDARNVISGNGANGLFLVGTAASNNVVQGNLIGVDSAGSAPIPNAGAGIGASGAPANVLGGTGPGAGNVISGNQMSGMYLMGAAATGNLVLGNKIGTDLSGTKAVGNSWEGIYLERSCSNIIGGSCIGACNLVSANAGRGVWLTNSLWNMISGNLIGTAADGMTALGNAWHAIECDSGATDNIIGRPGAGNTIAFANSGFAGVRIRPGSRNNSIRANAIFSNGGLGIDLGDAGVSFNDACDTDSGANLLQNFPVLTQAVAGNGIAIRGTLDSTAGGAYILEFFANPMCDSAGSGEGRLFLGELRVTAAADCSAPFLARFPVVLRPGSVVTATATDSAGNTSEFSPCVAVLAVPGLSSALDADGSLRLSWPATPGTFVLKHTLSLSMPVEWRAVQESPRMSAGEFIVRLPRAEAAEFFLLMFE